MAGFGRCSAIRARLRERPVTPTKEADRSLGLGAGTRTPAPRRERGELGQGRVRAARQRCLEALYRDGAEPRHLKRWNSIGPRKDFGRILLLSEVNPYWAAP